MKFLQECKEYYYYVVVVHALCCLHIAIPDSNFCGFWHCHLEAFSIFGCVHAAD